jgi:hypothetical protein
LDEPGTTVPDHEVVGESRWPMVGAVLAAALLTILLPDRLTFGPPWLVPVGECILLVALVLGDPGRITRRTKVLRVASIVLVGLLAASALWDTTQLVKELISGGPATNSASELLSTGSVILLCNAIAFALLYWELDGGGPAARAHRLPAYPAFAFPQQMSPQLAPASWRPRFADYLYIGITNSVAFSPTDAMPQALWAKAAMAVQATISLALLGLVLARAVNVLT